MGRRNRRLGLSSDVSLKMPPQYAQLKLSQAIRSAREGRTQRYAIRQMQPQPDEYAKRGLSLMTIVHTPMTTLWLE